MNYIQKTGALFFAAAAASLYIGFPYGYTTFVLPAGYFLTKRKNQN